VEGQAAIPTVVTSWPSSASSEERQVLLGEARRYSSFLQGIFILQHPLLLRKVRSSRRWGAANSQD